MVNSTHVSVSFGNLISSLDIILNNFIENW
jgi:hypothetical protein